MQSDCNITLQTAFVKESGQERCEKYSGAVLPELLAKKQLLAAVWTRMPEL